MEKVDPEDPFLYKTKRDYFCYKNNLNKCQKLLKRKDEYPTKFERISTSRDDNSAIISLILRNFEDDKFWKVQNLQFIMKSFADEQSGNIKNLLSILMFDWHEKSENSQTNYHLSEKCKNFKKISHRNKSLFEHLLNTVNNEKYKIYFQICIKIIFYYFERGHRLEHIDIQNLVIATFELNDNEHRNQILKILVVHLDNIRDENLENLKIRILQHFEEENDKAKIYYGSLLSHCDKFFFKLAFYLKENLIANFKVEFKKFVKTYQHYFGEYWSHAIQFNSQLLYNIAKKQQLKDIENFLLFELQNVDINQISYFSKASEFSAVFNEPLEKDDKNTLVRFFMILGGQQKNFFRHALFEL